MRMLRPLVPILAVLLCWTAPAQEVRRFRQWIDGVESGGAEEIRSRQGAVERIEHREWTVLERLGSSVRQEVAQDALRRPDGTIQLTWRVKLSEDPLVGSAEWDPASPGTLRIAAAGGAARALAVPSGALLWPADEDAALMAAARTLKSVKLTEFSASTQQWGRLDLHPAGPAPLPGFPDAVRFTGQGLEGAMTAELEVWISPTHGEVKQLARMAGFSVLLQRAELPPPVESPGGNRFFERTLAALPPHPFLLWIPEATLRWSGPGPQRLPEDAQQTRLDGNRYRVARAAPPTPEEAAQLPVDGTPSPEEAPYLVPSPLLQFQEPVFKGLVTRLGPPPHATRWELARRVTSFVYDWITQKDLSVGFASALEVARNAKGDCTEHGVLAVALLRKLGVPARGAVGWAALNGTMGLHFWVEVRIGGRWIPVDPTFDEAPASALRLRLASPDLSDLGSIGWDTAALSFVGGSWVPERPWTEAIQVAGERVGVAGGPGLRVPGGRWSLEGGRLSLEWMGRHGCEAVLHPDARQRAGARLLGGTAGRRGWWDPSTQVLWSDLGDSKWLRVDKIDEPSAFRLLDLLETIP